MFGKLQKQELAKREQEEVEDMLALQEDDMMGDDGYLSGFDSESDVDDISDLQSNFSESTNNRSYSVVSRGSHLSKSSMGRQRTKQTRK